MYLLSNGRIILEDEILENHAILVDQDRIKAILPEDQTHGLPGVGRIDALGGYISPGFIDIHSDYIEKVVAPRPTALMDMKMAVKECERILISHGITTMFHSLSLHDKESDKNPARRPDNAVALIKAINHTRDRFHLIHHRVHARFEITAFNMIEPVMGMLDEGLINLLSFMDHTPGQGQYADLATYHQYIDEDENQLGEEGIARLIKAHQEKPKVPKEVLGEMAQKARDMGIALASHDDDSAAKIDAMKDDFGATISEFPVNLDVAKYATDQGLWTIGGAPNILLGGSHSGNLSAAEGIREGVVNIISSDYYPSSLIHAVFHMHRKEGIPLTRMFRMLTINPAKATQIDKDYGSIAEGKKADLLVIYEEDGGYPAILNVMVDGVPAYNTVYRL